MISYLFLEENRLSSIFWGILLLLFFFFFSFFISNSC